MLLREFERRATVIRKLEAKIYSTAFSLTRITGSAKRVNRLAPVHRVLSVRGRVRHTPGPYQQSKMKKPLVRKWPRCGKQRSNRR
jgi:hypothetical protein